MSDCPYQFRNELFNELFIVMTTYDEGEELSHGQYIIAMYSRTLIIGSYQERDPRENMRRARMLRLWDNENCLPQKVG